MRPARLCVRKNWKRLSLLRGAAPATPRGRSILGEYGAHMGAGFQPKIFHMGSKIGNSGRYTRGRPVDPQHYYTTLGRTCQVVILHKKTEPISGSVIVVAVGIIFLAVILTRSRPRAVGVKMAGGVFLVLVLIPVAAIIRTLHFPKPPILHHTH